VAVEFGGHGVELLADRKLHPAVLEADSLLTVALSGENGL
jgi:hypothetical protein